MPGVDELGDRLTPELLRRTILSMADEASPSGGVTLAVVAIAERPLAGCGFGSPGKQARARAQLARGVMRRAGAIEGGTVFSTNDE